MVVKNEERFLDLTEKYRTPSSISISDRQHYCCYCFSIHVHMITWDILQILKRIIIYLKLKLNLAFCRSNCSPKIKKGFTEVCTEIGEVRVNQRASLVVQG